jgi:1-acyl-sn-glycerol-3-phosphate acyltransferase
MKTFRVAGRFCGVTGVFAFAWLDFLLRFRLTGRARHPFQRARWLRFWARITARVLNLRVRAQGAPPTSGIIAANHLSYLDIVVLASVMECAFVAKSEIASWPVIGSLTRCGGTLYIVRQQRGDVLRMAEEMKKVVEAGVPLVLFLEGTSTGGATVLPFRSSLLSPVEKRGWPATPAWLHYSLQDGDGSVADEICYWRDMVFGPHFLNMISKKRIEAVVRFGPSFTAPLDRKQMARELHAAVCQLEDAFFHPVAEITPNSGR